MKNFLKIVAGTMSILGAIVGAGFMSGAEINQFFTRFGWAKYITFAITGAIVYVYIIKIHKKTQNNINLETYTNKNATILPFCQLFISATMMAGLCDVLAGFGMQRWVCVFVCMSVIFVCLVVGVGFARVINVLTTLLLLLILPVVYVCSNNIVGESVSFSVNIETFFVAVFYSIFYCAMNLATSSTIIEDSAQKFDKSGVKVLGFAVSATIVCLIAVISKMAAKTFSQDMPLLSLVGDGAVKIVFVVLLVFAMLSTLLSSCVGAKKMFCKTNNLVASCLLSCLIALVSFVGFAGLVKYVYPLIGAAIIVEFVFRVFIDIYNMRKKEKLSQN